MKPQLNIRRWGYPLVLAAAVVFVFTPLTFSLTHFKAGTVTSDFPAFMELTEHMEQGAGDVPGYHIAHPLWEILVIAANHLFGVSLRTAAFLVTISSILAAALVLYFWLEPILEANSIPRSWGVVAAIGLNLVTPLGILAAIDRQLSAGYIGTITYNNPTIILLRPLAILQFIFAVRCFREANPMRGQTGVAAAVTILAALAKPSFAICIIPAMSLLAAERWLKKQRVDWQLLILGFMVPSIAVLAWQFVVAFGSPGQSAIIFYPFGVLSTQSHFLLLKFLLSILFPLLVAILYFREAARDPRLVLAWLSFLFGAFFAYFLAFGPPLTFDGDFIWGARITLLILFCVSTLFVFERIRALHWRAVLSGAAWPSHVVYGIVYYYRYLTTQKFM